MKASIFPTLRSAAIVFLACSLSACMDSRPPGSDYLVDVGGLARHEASGGPHHPAPAIPDDISYWSGDEVSGKSLIKINRSEQKASFYKGGVLVGVSRISSGKEDHGTPAGIYKIKEKDKDHKSTLYGVFKDKRSGKTINDNVDIRVDKIPPGAEFFNAPMPNFMRFADGIGMHTGYLPGYAASHGCVRMPHAMAEKFFENVQLGTPVIVE
ncbi:MAG: L,D-transpeptidase family protein [Verrucomicrobia bacterium]|nr:MAG: L,D-transpeptidase family protein [Verrucomicrobiota bacterium]